MDSVTCVYTYNITPPYVSKRLHAMCAISVLIHVPGVIGQSIMFSLLKEIVKVLCGEKTSSFNNCNLTS